MLRAHSNHHAAAVVLWLLWPSSIQTAKATVHGDELIDSGYLQNELLLQPARMKQPVNRHGQERGLKSSKSVLLRMEIRPLTDLLVVDFIRPKLDPQATENGIVRAFDNFYYVSYSTFKSCQRAGRAEMTDLPRSSQNVEAMYSTAAKIESAVNEQEESTLPSFCQYSESMTSACSKE